MAIASFIILFVYLITMSALLVGFLKTPKFILPKNPPKTRFSIIIPFRNEAENLPELLDSLQKINYPPHLFEIIFVDDASNDGSVKCIEEFFILKSTSTLRHAQCNAADSLTNSVNFQIIKNKRFSASPKKDAITKAISIASHEWIVTTDADCVVPETWLQSYDAVIQQKNLVFIAGPVCYSSENLVLDKFQQMDGLSLQLVAAGSIGLKIPTLCNGANVAYKKECFEKINGFANNNHIASGDDTFMLQNMKFNFPKKLLWFKSKSNIVTTKTTKGFNAIIDQRVRWASKVSVENLVSVGLGFIVFLVNTFLLIGAFWCFLQNEFLPFYVLFLFLKLLIDIIVLVTSGRFFNIKINGIYFLTSALMYPFITVLVVLKSFRGNHIWKGRTFKNNAKLN